MTSDLPPDDLPWDALARYFAGELPADEAANLERWIGANPERAERVEQLRRMWTAAVELQQTWDTKMRSADQAGAGGSRTHHQAAAV